MKNLHCDLYSCQEYKLTTLQAHLTKYMRAVYYMYILTSHMYTRIYACRNRITCNVIIQLFTPVVVLLITIRHIIITYIYFIYACVYVCYGKLLVLQINCVCFT